PRRLALPNEDDADDRAGTLDGPSIEGKPGNLATDRACPYRELNTESRTTLSADQLRLFPKSPDDFADARQQGRRTPDEEVLVTARNRVDRPVAQQDFLAPRQI